MKFIFQRILNKNNTLILHLEYVFKLKKISSCQSNINNLIRHFTTLLIRTNLLLFILFYNLFLIVNNEYRYEKINKKRKLLTCRVQSLAKNTI